VESPVEIKDSEVTRALSEAGINGVVSESTQFFLLDNWSGVETVPLDLLDEKLLEIDPRRDGYADKLRAFFVNEKSRRFFLPLTNWRGQSVETIESDIKHALNPIPVLGKAINARAPAVKNTFITIAVFALFFLLSLSMSFLLSAFFKDLFSDFNYYGKMKLRRGKSLGIIVILFAVYIAGSLFEGVPILRIILALVVINASSALHCFLFTRNAAQNEHSIFRPVFILMTTKSLVRGIFPKYTVFVLAASFALILLSLFTGGVQVGRPTAITSANYGSLVTSEDYEAHVAFQNAFSFIPLFTSDSPGSAATDGAPTDRYLTYAIDESGLYLSGEADMPPVVTQPPYPLSAITAFVTDVPPSAVAQTTAPSFAATPAPGLPLFLLTLAVFASSVILLRTEHRGWRMEFLYR
jgi:hypothetical protein